MPLANGSVTHHSNMGKLAVRKAERDIEHHVSKLEKSTDELAKKIDKSLLMKVKRTKFSRVALVTLSLIGSFLLYRKYKN